MAEPIVDAKRGLSIQELISNLQLGARTAAERVRTDTSDTHLADKIVENFATRQFIEGMVFASVSDKQQIADLLKVMEESLGDRDWAQKQRQALKVTTPELAEWSRRRRYSTATRKAVSKLLNPLEIGRDRGVTTSGREK